MSRAAPKSSYTVHVLLLDDAGHFELSPAFDVLPSGQALGYQQMRVGTDEADSTLTNAISMCSQFSLKKDQAVQEIRRVIAVIDGWRKHFATCGVGKNDIAQLIDHIDRPFLANQRSDF